MQFREYGTDQKETILLLRGGGLSWWNYREKVHIYVGEKETGEILRSAEAICRALPSGRLHRLPGLRHGAFSMNHADLYTDAIRQIVRGA